MDTLDRMLVDGRVIAAIISFVLATTVYYLLRKSEERAVDFHILAPEACRSDWAGKQLVNPSIKVPGSTAIQCYTPATGRSLGLINPATPDGIDRIIEKASVAQSQWKATTFAQRRRVLQTLLKYILDNQHDIVRAACRDSGKTRVDAMFGEILVTVIKLKWTIHHGEKTLANDRRPTNLLMFYKHNEVQYEPLGIIAACVSWNYPFHNLLGPLISGIFAGNAVIIKNSEQTAWSSSYFISIVRGALSACGHDPNLVHAVSCWPDAADYLTSHPKISHLTFIGSRPVARAVAKSASKVLIPLCVELGGKDAAIVLDHPDGRALSTKELQTITSMIMRGSFQSGGQNCVGIERVVAMPGAYDVLVRLLEPRVKALRVGDDLDPESDTSPIDVGAMQCSGAAFDRLEQLIAEAQAQGARLLAGGHRFDHRKYPNGHYFTPTLLAEVTPDMRIAREELFAPVCLLFRAKDIQDIIDINNSTIYGLGCSVFGPTSSSLARSNIKHVTSEVKTGMVAINDIASYYVVQLPFGGVGGSGYGRFAGEEGLRSLCNPKSVCSDRWPMLIKTAIPANLDYPMGPGAWHAARGVVEVGFGESLARRWRGIMRLMGF